MARILDFCILQAERELQEALFLARILIQEDRVPNVGVMGRFEVEAAIA